MFFNTTAPLWKKNLIVIWIAQFIGMIAMSACIPFLPLFVRQLGVNNLQEAQQWSGMISAAPFFMSIITVPLWGTLGDKYGRKLMVVRAILGLALAMGLMGFAQNVWQLFLLRMLQGAISGFIASTLAFVSSTTPKQHSGYAIAILQSSISAGPIVGSLVGGVLSDLVGVRAVFVYVSIACILSSLIVIAFVHEEKTEVNTEHKPSVLNNLRFALHVPALSTLLLLIFLVQSSIVFFSPILPFYLEELGAPKAQLSTLTGVFTGIGGLFSVLFARYWGKRSDRKGYGKTLRLASLVTGTATLLQAVVPRFELLFPLRAIAGIFTAALIPTLYAAFSKNSPQENRAGLMGLASGSTLLGNLVAPIICGWFASYFGAELALLLSGGIMFFVWYGSKKEETQESVTTLQTK